MQVRIEKIEAFKASDGRLFENEAECAAYEAIEVIKAFLNQRTTPNNDLGWAEFIVEFAGVFHSALDPLIQANKAPTMRGAS